MEAFVAAAAPGSNLLGILCYLFSTIFLTAMVSCVHALTQGGVPVFQVLLAREVVISVLASLRLLSSRRPLSAHRWELLALQAGLGSLAISCSLWAVRLLPLSDSMVLACLTPVWIVLLAPAWLQETPSRVSLLTVITCALGVYLIAKEKTLGDTSFGSRRTLGIILAVLQSLLAAFAKLVVRQIRSAATADLILLALSTVAAALAVAGCLAGGGLQMSLSPLQWLLLLGTGLAGYATQMSITIALQVTRQAAPAVATSYLAVLWSLLVGWLAFGELPSFISGCGAALICASTLLLGIYEHWRDYQDCRAVLQ